MKDEDFVDKLFVANTHDTLLCFSNRGQLYWLKVYQLPQAGRGSRGKPIVNLLPLEEGERITAVLPIREFEEDSYVFMATAPRHREEDAAVGVLAAARGRHHRGRPRRGRPAGGRGDHRRHARRHAVHDRAARQSASPRTTCGRWAATPPACAASACRTTSDVISLIIPDADGPDADRVRKRLRQADAGRRVPGARPRRPGRHRDADHRAQRPPGRGDAGRPRPTN